MLTGQRKGAADKARGVAADASAKLRGDEKAAGRARGEASQPSSDGQDEATVQDEAVRRTEEMMKNSRL